MSWFCPKVGIERRYPYLNGVAVKVTDNPEQFPRIFPDQRRPARGGLGRLRFPRQFTGVWTVFRAIRRLLKRLQQRVQFFVHFRRILDSLGNLQA